MLIQRRLGAPIYPTINTSIDEKTIIEKAAAKADDYDLSVAYPKSVPYNMARLSTAQLGDSLRRGNYLRFNQKIADKGNFWDDALPIVAGTKSVIRVDNKFGTRPDGSEYDYRSGIYEFGGQVSLEGLAEGSRIFSIFAQLRDIATNATLYDIEIWRDVSIATDFSVPLSIYYRGLRFSHAEICAVFRLDPKKVASYIFPSLWYDSPVTVNSCSLWLRQTTKLPSGM